MVNLLHMTLTVCHWARIDYCRAASSGGQETQGTRFVSFYTRNQANVGEAVHYPVSSTFARLCRIHQCSPFEIRFNSSQYSSAFLSSHLSDKIFKSIIHEHVTSFPSRTDVPQSVTLPYYDNIFLTNFFLFLHFRNLRPSPYPCSWNHSRYFRYWLQVTL